MSSLVRTRGCFNYLSEQLFAKFGSNHIRTSEVKHLAQMVTKSPPGISPMLTTSYLLQGCQQCRTISTSIIKDGQEVGAVQESRTPPTVQDLTQNDIQHMFMDIGMEFEVRKELKEISSYYFDGKGKAIRPLIVMFMARSINTHCNNNNSHTWWSQREVAKVAEMIHTASLLHDDVIDIADRRRGKLSINSLFGQRKSVMAGDYILSVSSKLLARIRNEDVVVILAQVLADLVQGEFMQLGSKENENERFAHYLKKTFKKTASLISYSCKAVAVLSEADENIQEVAFQYGRNVGIAFQLADDFLDFVASAKILGKSAGQDLKLGLATAPVLFACEKYPELNPMIMRRFQEPGDVAKAFEYVHESDGLEQTKFLVQQHCEEAKKVISCLKDSPEKTGLIDLADRVLNRVIDVNPNRTL